MLRRAVAPKSGHCRYLQHQVARISTYDSLLSTEMHIRLGNQDFFINLYVFLILRFFFSGTLAINSKKDYVYKIASLEHGVGEKFLFEINFTIHAFMQHNRSIVTFVTGDVHMISKVAG